MSICLVEWSGGLAVVTRRRRLLRFRAVFSQLRRVRILGVFGSGAVMQSEWFATLRVDQSSPLRSRLCGGAVSIA